MRHTLLLAALAVSAVVENSFPSAVTPAGHPPVGFALAASLRVAHATTVRVGLAREDGGYAVQTMALEEYVAGVLAGEAARDSSPSALEALAMTVRTFAMANLGRHRADGFDLCDQTHCQVLRKATAQTGRAAQATAGQILLYHGAPASVFYTASCGGRTERPSAVWPGARDPDFLPSRKDDACEGLPEWSADLPAEDLKRALRSGGFSGDQLRDLRILARTDSGRVARLRVEGFSPAEITGQDLRTVVGRSLGWQFIKSTSFDLRRNGSGFHFAGHGSGHGVGLCVIGAARLGGRGQSASQILARYFPGLEISPRAGAAPVVPSPVVTSPTGPELDVVLPAGDEGEREVLHDLAAQSRDALAKELGVAQPSRITLRFHPTAESYQRATLQPWFSTGATLRGEVHFPPLTVLRDRGVLEQTIRRALVRVLTARALAGRPLWVQEGAASYFAGERAVPAGRASCPSDNELLHPTSPGALSTAHARATACFAHQIASGRKWTEVR